MQNNKRYSARSAKRRKGSGESGPQCPHRGLSRSDWGVDGMVSFVWLNNEMALF